MKEIYPLIQSRLQEKQFQGLSIAVIRHGKLHDLEGFGLQESGSNRLVTHATQFHACSISKFATSLLALRFVERGLLDLDEDVNIRLRTWKISDHDWTWRKKVTLRSLLCHQAGIIDPEESFPVYHSAQGNPSMLDILTGRTSYCSEPFTVRHEPLSQFYYSDAGFCLIQQIIEDLCEKSFTEVMNDHLFEPLNMTQSTYDSVKSDYAFGHDKLGYIVEGDYPIYPYPAAAGLWSTPADLSKLVIEVMDAVKGNSRLGLSAETMIDMLSPQGCSQWTGLGIFLDPSGSALEFSSLGWGVGFQSMIVAYPSLGTGAVLMTNTDTGVHQTKGILGEVLRALCLAGD